MEATPEVKTSEPGFDLDEPLARWLVVVGQVREVIEAYSLAEAHERAEPMLERALAQALPFKVRGLHCHDAEHAQNPRAWEHDLDSRGWEDGVQPHWVCLRCRRRERTQEDFGLVL